MDKSPCRNRNKSPTKKLLQALNILWYIFAMLTVVFMVLFASTGINWMLIVGVIVLQICGVILLYLLITSYPCRRKDLRHQFSPWCQSDNEFEVTERMLRPEGNAREAFKSLGMY
ncbi:Hypothetical_protein [Hexamita inflata]|uniref:Hypothetical_protein n=1 Tax=Hexamita inflata TaxID=28002 RepID=A0AA86P8M5_9EUKA|nr:Hypothetical protein HINF_LOCUS21545 [Hexamita inflata]CAI9974064.1 Hypothetical protein HINF_LOCUS61709 [Hexamita inflata]